jgi:hypothetical protein
MTAKPGPQYRSTMLAFRSQTLSSQRQNIASRATASVDGRTRERLAMPTC